MAILNLTLLILAIEETPLTFYLNGLRRYTDPVNEHFSEEICKIYFNFNQNFTRCYKYGNYSPFYEFLDVMG